MQCPQCATVNPTTNTHCSQCYIILPLHSVAEQLGQNQQSVSAQSQVQANAAAILHAQRTCPRCLRLIAASSKFCNICGFSVVNPQPSYAHQSIAYYNPNQPAGAQRSYNPPSIAQQTPLSRLTGRMMNISIGMRVIGAMIFLLFFSPFVSCGRTELSGAQISTSVLAESSQGRGDEESVLWVSLLLVPLAGLLLCRAGFRVGKEIPANPATVSIVYGTQFLLVVSFFLLFVTFINVKFGRAAAFLELEWGYKMSVVMLINGIIVTRMWHKARTQAQHLQAPPDY